MSYEEVPDELEQELERLTEDLPDEERARLEDEDPDEPYELDDEL
jgi:hypothetical protein